MKLETTPYPLLNRPVLKSKIWGGRNLESLFGIALPESEMIGEAWIVADLPEGSSIVANGPFAGRTLSEVTETWGERLIGPAWRGKPTGKRFPLLIKFLDARDDLSVQVHPDEKACRDFFPKDYSKDESWVILARDAGGKILKGFTPGADIETFDRLIREDRVLEILRTVPVGAGEVYRIAPGTVHALCKGVTILEVQEPSDSTFRIYDYGRFGDDGKPRALHLDAARKVMRFEADDPPQQTPIITPKPWGRHEMLVDVPAYRMERVSVERRMDWEVDPRSTQAIVVLEGEGVLETEGHSLPAKQGESVLLPAVTGRVSLKPQGRTITAVLAGAGNVAMVK